MRIELEVIDRNHKKPLHRQLAEVIRGAIRAGVYKPGQKIETEQEFLRSGKFSYPTVARAFRDLVEEGIVIRKRGLGTFVSDGYAQPRQTRLKKVGVANVDVSNEFFMPIFHGIEEQCRHSGYGPVPISMGTDRGGEERALRDFERHQVEGIMVIPSPLAFQHDKLVGMISNHMPVVLMDSYLPEAACDTVTVNNEHAGYQLAQHLIELRHKRIGFIGQAIKYPYGSTILARQNGLERALREARLPADPRWNKQIALRLLDKDVKRAVSEILELPAKSRPTALMCAYDGMAAILMRILREAGVALPEEMSVTGFDDLTVASLVDPPLTTVRQPRKRIGREAANLFFRRVQHSDVGYVHMVLDASLVIRQSTAPHGQRASA